MDKLLEKPLILASSSPRRQEILRLAGLKFQVEPSLFSEAEMLEEFKYSSQSQRRVENLVEALALAKALEVKERLATPDLILAADTIVYFAGEILGKPENLEVARQMLLALAGQKHTVYSGVALVKGKRTESFFAETSVEFYPADEFYLALLEKYLELGSSLDKAGGYGIQDLGAGFVKAIEGDFYNVMGLPLAQSLRAMQRFLAR